MTLHSATPNDALTLTIQGLGYATLVDFAREQARSLLLQKIAYYQGRIDYFEQKYSVDYERFCQEFAQIKMYSVLEKEDDSMVWETALDVINGYRSELLALNQ